MKLDDVIRQALNRATDWVHVLPISEREEARKRIRLALSWLEKGNYSACADRVGTAQNLQLRVARSGGPKSSRFSGALAHAQSALTVAMNLQYVRSGRVPIERLTDDPDIHLTSCFALGLVEV
jgi:hypothetical protein